MTRVDEAACGRDAWNLEGACPRGDCDKKKKKRKTHVQGYIKDKVREVNTDRKFLHEREKISKWFEAERQ